MKDTVITMDNSFHMKIEDSKGSKMNQGVGTDATHVLPEYVWKPDPKGRTYVHDLPPENLSKVQDFIRQQRKELERYYRLNNQRKGSVVGTPKARKEKFHLVKFDAQLDKSSLRQGVFGFTLDELLENDRQTDPGRRIPRFFEELIVYLEQHITEEGILRKAGNERDVKDLKQEINTDYYDGGFSWEDMKPHNAASLLKHFLKDLPVKLLSTPGEHPDAFLKVQGIPPTIPEDQLKALHLLVLLITDVQRDTLQLLLRFLKKVVDNHKENKMTPGNVATVMAPNLFPFDMDPNNMEKIGRDNVFSMKAVQMLVKYQDILWSIPQFVITEIRRKFGSQQGLLNTSLSPVSQWGSLKHKVPQILTEKYFTELVKIKVTIPHLSKTTKVELEERTTAKDILDKFAARLYKKSSSAEADRPIYNLYEVGGTIEERKLPMDSIIISIHSENPRADWIIK